MAAITMAAITMAAQSMSLLFRFLLLLVNNYLLVFIFSKTHDWFGN